jgi:hypothetical protein
MSAKRDDQSSVEQGKHNTDMRRDTAVRGSMGTPASGRDTEKVTPDSDMFKDQPQSERSSEKVPGSASESRRPTRQPGRLPLPD